MKRYIAVVLWMSFLLCGCRTEATVSEQVVVTGLGIDYRDGQYVVSIQAVEPMKTSGSLSEQQEIATAVYTAEGKSVAEALQAFLNKTGKDTYILQNQIIVISLAQCQAESLYSVLDYFIRNQEGRALVDLVVCRGDPSAVLNVSGGSDAIPAEYVSQLLEEAQRWSQSVESRLLDVERSLGGVCDVALPLLEMRDGTPTLSGTALFRGGEFAGELTVHETPGLLLSEGETPLCLYTMDGAALRCENKDSSLVIERHEAGWTYRLSLSASVSVVEEITPLSEDTKRELLRRLEARMADEITAALTKTVVTYGSDPLGLARRTAANYRTDGVTQQAVQKVLRQSRFEVRVSLSMSADGFLK